jgi:ribosomal protein S18 acetylase RimI-like enzyme
MLELVGLFPGQYLHVIDLPYRLTEWSAEEPGNTLLFEDSAGELQAWAALRAPFWAVDIYMRRPELYGQVLEQVSVQAEKLLNSPTGRPSWFICVFEDQADWIAALEEAGFTCQSYLRQDAWLKALLVRGLGSSLPEVRVPAGFKLRALKGLAEVPAYVDLHRIAFGSENMTVEWRARSLAQPGYDPSLDLVVEAPDGRLAAFCIGWFNRTGRDGLPAGQIEPLGVHPDFRRRGLSAALLAEEFRRMAGLGAQKVYVETDDYPDRPAFLNYQAAGFALERIVLVYRKDFA